MDMPRALGGRVVSAMVAMMLAGVGPAVGQESRPGPYVIAHRGASGALPEHTVESYKLAVDEGADFIECDVVVTKDKRLVCRHEPLLSGTTDADTKFPDRMTSYTIDGEVYEGVFSTDLTLQEIKTLRAVQSNELRDPQYDGLYEVPTLEEYIAVAQGAPRVVGIYPETKHPSWHNGLPLLSGTSMEDLLLRVLADSGYQGGLQSDTWAAQPCFIQSFEVGNLKHLAGKTDIPLVQLLGGWPDYVTPDTGATHEEMSSEDGLAGIATYAAGVGLWKDTILPPTESGYIGPSTGVVQRAQALGMQVHAYTFRNEDSYLPWTWAQDPYPEMFAFLQREGLDGLFSDFPATAVAYRERVQRGMLETLDVPIQPGIPGTLPMGSGGGYGYGVDDGTADEERVALPADRPWIVAHRGACGVLPEHTVEAYQTAVEQGADFIECDVVVTKDLRLVCRHEPLLSGTTDADTKFPDRMTSYTIDGEVYEGVFSTDLTLQEIKTLRAVQARDARDPNHNGKFEVPTLEEYIAVAQGAPRVVGIYPETKHPSWHNGLPLLSGTSMEDLLLRVLADSGYQGGLQSDTWAAQPCFIQSFEVENLKYISGKTDLPLIQLLGGNPDDVTPDTGQTLAEMTSEEGVAAIAVYAAGVGPSKAAIVPVDTATRRLEEPTTIVDRMHAHGLQVHPYTFRNEAAELAFDYVVSARAEYALFFKEIGIDGAFTDFSGTAYDWLTEEQLKGTQFDKMLPRQ